jgi:hypothetical protein
LAGLTKPLNYFEAAGYLKKALKELNIEEKTGDAGIISIASFYIKEMAEAKNLQANLSAIRSYAFENLDSIFDFYLLHCAWRDLENGEDQLYWPDADAGNIKNIIIERAKRWLAENKEHIY